MLDYNEMVASMIILANAETFLVCVELGEIPPLCKLKELICEARSMPHILLCIKVYSNMAVQV